MMLMVGTEVLREIREGRRRTVPVVRSLNMFGKWVVYHIPYGALLNPASLPSVTWQYNAVRATFNVQCITERTVFPSREITVTSTQDEAVW